MPGVVEEDMKSHIIQTETQEEQKGVKMSDWMDEQKHQVWINALLTLWILGVIAVYLICYGPPEFESFFSRLGFEKEFAALSNSLTSYFYQFWKYTSL